MTDSTTESNLPQSTPSLIVHDSPTPVTDVNKHGISSSSRLSSLSNNIDDEMVVKIVPSTAVKTVTWLVLAISLAQLVVPILIFSYFAYDLEHHQTWGKTALVEIIKFRSQSFDVLFRFFSLFGFETFFVIVPLAMWWGNVRAQSLGVNLSALMQVVYLWLSLFKLYFQEPRPYWIDSSLTSHSAASVNGDVEFSYPSGKKKPKS
jgi:hypothetical protein